MTGPSGNPIIKEKAQSENIEERNDTGRKDGFPWIFAWLPYRTAIPMNAYIALDVGGTQIKSAVAAGGKLFAVHRGDAYAQADAETILENLAGIIMAREKELREQGYGLAGVGLAFPGPFDYERGVSRIRGIGKYDAIYGMNLRARLSKACGLPEEQFAFQNDADLFALGEGAFGQAKGFRRSMMICIGTGLGSGFIENGRLVKSGPRVPENGWIYSLPYRDGIVDQYLSATGLGDMLRESGCFPPAVTVKEAAELARQGNGEAQGIFEEFGRRLAEVVPSAAARFGAECLVVGGQVAKSSGLFCHSLEEALRPLGIELRVSEDSSGSAMRAVPLLFR